MIRVTQVIKTKIAWQILGFHQLLRSSDLVVKLIKNIVVREVSWNLEALKWEVLVSAVSHNFFHARVPFFQDLKLLLTIMHTSNFSIIVLLLDLWLLLICSDVGQSDGLNGVVFLRDFVPDECKAVFAQVFNGIYHSL